MMQSITELANALSSGKVTSVELTENALAKIEDAKGEGARVFTKVYRDGALAAAKASDLVRRHAGAQSPLAGIPISIKDLFDVAGEITLAGSKVRREDKPATVDAPVINRLRQAGAVIVGKTNMSEFAFSGLGLNPHYGTPKNPWDRVTGRIPGGSTSGGAVSVSDGMAAATIGTDTGGSLRIPAAFCGLVGFKPTASRIDKTGGFPLSQTLDSIGPMAPTVRCCAILDAILAGNEVPDLHALPLRGLRLGVVQDYVLEKLDPEVAAAFAAAVKSLSAAGAQIVDVRMPQLNRIPEINKKGGLIAAEAFAIHQKNLESEAHAAQFDARIVARILRGRDMSAMDYIRVMQERAELKMEVEQIASDYDALLMPTVAIVPPAIAPLDKDPQLFMETNGLALRNTTVINFIDGCAISIPCNAPGAAPVGLMLAAAGGGDSRLFRVALAVESAMNQHRAAQ
jgi:aspartyl-tRNA(Asn)/glutamyl-tRNA(Gln) amidotransferase subunit A